MPFDAENYVPATVDPRSLTTPRERLVYLRDFLRDAAPSHLFDMRTSGTLRTMHGEWCGTAGCFHGWTKALFGTTHDYESEEMIGVVGASRLGGLFYPEAELSDGTAAIVLTDPVRAANVLTHLINTGSVDWSVA